MKLSLSRITKLSIIFTTVFTTNIFTIKYNGYFQAGQHTLVGRVLYQYFTTHSLLVLTYIQTKYLLTTTVSTLIHQLLPEFIKSFTLQWLCQ